MVNSTLASGRRVPSDPAKRRAAVWKTGRYWVCEKGCRHSKFKVFAVITSPTPPNGDTSHNTWRQAMDAAFAYVGAKT